MICWKIESAIRSFTRIFYFHFPPPCDRSIAASTVLHLGNHTFAKLLRRKLNPRLNQRRILLRRQSPDSLSTLPRIQLSRSVTVCSRNSSVATS